MKAKQGPIEKAYADSKDWRKIYDRGTTYPARVVVEGRYAYVIIPFAPLTEQPAKHVIPFEVRDGGRA